MISLVSMSSLPAFMIALARVQQISRCSGFEASARQKFGTRSIFFVALISSKIALIFGFVVDSSTRFTVGIKSPKQNGRLRLRRRSRAWQHGHGAIVLTSPPHRDATAVDHSLPTDRQA